MRTLLLSVVLLLHGALHAQEPLVAITQKKESKPLLFASLPDQFECSSAALQTILSKGLNEQFSTQVSSQFLIAGKIIYHNQPVPGTISINMRLENYHNALFNLTARLMADNSMFIQGRIVHPRYGDVLVLTKNKDKYYFKKNSLRLLMPE